MGNQISGDNLVKATQDGNVNDVLYQLKNKVDPNYKDKNGKTALYFAAGNGHEELVSILISAGADVNHQSTPLEYAAREGHKQIMSLLISHGANVDKLDMVGESSLYSAAVYSGSKECVELLILKNANVNRANRNGSTPLHGAVNNKEITAMLISKGVMINKIDNTGKIPLHIAAEYSFEETIELLISEGANVNQANEDGKTPLHFAIDNYCTKAIDLLIKNGANVDQTDNNGITPLLRVCENETIYFLRFPTRKHVSIHKPCKKRKQERKRIVPLLISAGANVNHTANDGRTPLHAAVQKYDNDEVVSILLQANADFTIQDNDGLTPLMIAKYTNARLLTDHINGVNCIKAIKSGDAKQLKSLLDQNTSPNFVDWEGNSLLHHAIYSNNSFILQILLDTANIQLDILNKNETPFILAMKLRSRQLIKMIDLAMNKPMSYIDIADVQIADKEILGKGTFGAVYKGKYKNEIVAIKSFTTQTDDPHSREINTMLQCRSPYLLHLVAVAQIDSNEFKLVLQYMDGGDLQNHVVKKAKKEPTVTNYSELEIAWAIANGLADIHHSGCIHRDIKSSNILLSTKHYVKLADFGLTREVDSKMTLGAGTPRWTAPEVLSDRCEYNVPADIYSFGVVLTELDTLMLPYSNSTLTDLAIMNAVLHNNLRPDSSANCASWYKDLVDRCLEYEPTQRPTAFEIIRIIDTAIANNWTIHSDEEDKTQVELLQDVVCANSSSAATTASTSSSLSTSKAFTPLPQVAFDINCPSCKVPNSILNEVCTQCKQSMLPNPVKVKILVRRLVAANATLSYYCPVCHLENNINAINCLDCDANLTASEKLQQLVDRSTSSQAPLPA